MSNNNFYHDPSRAKAAKQIRDFLQHPILSSGGILLVTGQRGSGKTRLVDEALNDRRREYRYGRTPGKNIFVFLVNAIQYLLSLLNFSLKPTFGSDPVRKRRLVIRSPRGARRIVLPVPVDPFFICNAKSVNQKKDADQEGETNKDSDAECQVEQDVIALLYNVIFALTSFIDPRGAPHQHGRTLGAWVGWPTLWFTSTALYRPQGRLNWFWVWVLVVLSYVGSFLLGNLISIQLDLPTIPINDYLGYVGLLAFFGISVLAAWLLLRWRDLRGLKKRGSQLYDLAHAQKAEKTVQLELRQQLNAKIQWQRILLLLLGLLFSGSGLLFFQTAQLPKVAAAALAALGVFTLVISINQQYKQHATFGMGNKNWMVTLIRRYLFQLHRAGFEPVLIIDEIDKLKDSSNDTSVSELQRFEESLCRIKQSLVAEFLWVLIDNGRFARDVMAARRLMETDALSTLVQAEIYTEALPYAEFYTYAQSQLDKSFDQYKPWLPHWWILSRGIFSNLARYISHVKLDGASSDSLDVQSIAQAKLTTNVIAHLLEDDMKNLTQYASLGTQKNALSNLLKNSGWHRMWVMNGMLDFANHLYVPQELAFSWQELDKKSKQFGPNGFGSLDNPLWLQHLGAIALVLVLDTVYRGTNGLEDAIAPAGNGIDLGFQQRNYYQPMKLVVTHPWIKKVIKEE